jgi:hypothetical protein
MSTTLTGRLRLGFLGISPEEASFRRRNFAGAAPAPRRRLEQVGRTFVVGYRAGLAETRPDRLADVLGRVAQEDRGFAFEGAAMAYALLDALRPFRGSLLSRLAAGPGRAHVYMVHVGAGWALARLRRGPAAIRRLDPLLGWLALDGAGFHEGYFHPRATVLAGRRPRGYSGYAGRAFDQGLGRSLWFVHGADPERVVGAIGRLAIHRRADLWSGVGLAATYAGGADLAGLRKLVGRADAHRHHLAQGAVFAAAARECAGNPATHSDLACRTFAGLPAREAGALCVAMAEDLEADGADPAYEAWRRRVRDALPGPAPSAAAPS